MKIDKRAFEQTKDGSTSPLGVGACLLDNAHHPIYDTCQFTSSCHVFASNGNSSQITRFVKDMSTTAASPIFLSRYKAKRRKAKSAKISSLPTTSQGTNTLSLLAALGAKRLYISGCGNLSLPNQLRLSTVWPVTYLKQFGDLKGGHIPEVCTLLPESWVSSVFTDKQEIAAKSEKPDLSGYFVASNEILNNHPNLVVRGKYRAPVFEEKKGTYFTCGTTAARNQRGLIPVMRKLLEMEERKILDKLFRKVEHASLAYIDSKSISIIRAAKKLAGYSGYAYMNGKESLVWSAVALSKNAYLNKHCDPDFFMAALMVLSPGDSSIVQHMCFPKYGISVPLRNGTILLFNPREEHCVSSRVDVQRDVIIASFYLKTAVIGGNDNSRTVDDL